MLFIGVSSEALIITLLGERWLQTATFLSIMCYGAMLYPLHALNLNMLNVKGRSDLFLKISLVKKLLVVVAVIIAVRYGIIAMLYTMLVNSIIAYFINSYYSGKLIGYYSIEQLRDILPSFCVTALSAIFAFLLNHFTMFSHFITLISQFCLMLISTILLSELSKLEPYLELKSILMERFEKIRKFRIASVKNGTDPNVLPKQKLTK